MGLKDLRKKAKKLFETPKPVEIGAGATYEEAEKDAKRRLPSSVDDYEKIREYEDPEGENGMSKLVAVEYEKPKSSGGGMDPDMVNQTLDSDDGYEPSL